MTLPVIEFEQILESVDKLTSEQKEILRRKLDGEWASEFRAAINAIRADMPADISEEEIQADIERAIEEVRSMKP
ncbi:MAG: hypothetical protein BroJett018_30410 [Chloroflexota bacterium]|nr:hypothetical protein [Chloroflexota bacterium]NOG65056.1 hypothetical protein [Chloroflexota bacterium]GIK65247.1 MAG: hypothetical protein BroJett018_30410 [Chloroflexota bacterium]